MMPAGSLAQRKPSAGVIGAPVPKDYGNIGASATLYLSTADHHFGTLTANVTLTLDAIVGAAPDRMLARVRLTQDGTGSRAVAWAGVTWLNGITPTLQTAAGLIDEFEFEFISSVPTWSGRQLGKNINANTTGSAGSVGASLTPGSFLTPTDTYNGSTARTFNVDATSANTASKVVARDASGNFAAGTITAALSGNATTATTATQVSQSLTAGTYMTSGGTYNGSTARAFDVDAEETDAVVTLAPSTSGSITLDAASDTLAETRIGRKVTLTGRLIVASVSLPVGDLRITGLTHAVAAGEKNFAAVAVRGGGFAAAAVTQLQGYAEPGTSRLVIEKYSVGGAAPLAGDVQADTSIIINCTYNTTP